jgi:hypothetical protein
VPQAIIVAQVFKSTPKVTFASRDLIERPFETGVEATMEQVRVILALLISAAWFAGAANSLFASAGHGGAGSGKACCVSVGGDCKHHAAISDCHAERSARRWSRRLHAHPGAPEDLLPAAISQVHVARRNDSIGFAGHPHFAWEFANSWQFHLRAALDVRAPSSVS